MIDGVELNLLRDRVESIEVKITLAMIEEQSFPKQREEALLLSKE